MTGEKGSLRSDGEAADGLSGDARRCHQCGALNPASAGWCGQCLAAFAPLGGGHGTTTTSAPETAGATGAPETTSEAGVDHDVRDTFRVADDGITWTCRTCEAINALEAVVCAVCGATLAATLRPPQPRGPIRDPGTAALLSLALPGAGHAYLGLWGPALARAVTGLWVLSIAVISATQRGFAPMPVLFSLAALALWLVVAHDAYRESMRHESAVLMRGHALLWTVLGLLGLSMLMLFTSAIAVRT